VALLVSGGCGRADQPRAGAPPAGAASPAAPSAATTTASVPARQVDLSKTDACKLATADEAAAALGAAVKDVYSSRPLEGIGCEYDTASKGVYLLLQVQPDPELYFSRDGKPISGLGDAAFAHETILGGGEKVEVLVGDLVLTLQRIDPAARNPSDLAAIDDHLARLAHLVLPRLPS